MPLGRSVDIHEEKRRHPFLRVVLILFFLFLLVLAGAVFTAGIWLKHKMQSSLPEIDGALLTPGLTTQVIVRRDHHGVPHIEAANLDDLLFAQGYVTAQDRLWQMDMARRMASGEAAEILGSRLLEHDRMQRMLAVRVTAERLTAALPADERRLFDDYARGVNAYIGSHMDRLPAEFRLLFYQPKPWQPVDSMLVVMSMVQMLDEHWPEKLERERITARLGPTLAADLYPTGSWRDHPPVTDEVPITMPNQNLPDVPLDESQDGFGAARLDSPILHDDLRRLEQLTGHPPCVECGLDTNPGSNQWVVSGARTASGSPILSNDMHLAQQIPNIWYMTGLKAPGLHAAGVTVPGLPLIVAGHNDHIAWGFTALYGDTQDLYVEHTNGQDQYQTPDGVWHPFEHAQETIHVRGGQDVTVNVERTGHGVVITPLIPGEKRTITLKWNEYDARPGGYPLLAIDEATDWAGFRAALRNWSAPTQNVVYADDQGHIGYQAVGYIPSRPNGLAGVPIDDEQHEWQGYIGFDQLPSAYDPPGGLLATANARVTPNPNPPTTPVAGAPVTGTGPGESSTAAQNPAPRPELTLEWGDPYRNERIWKWLSPKDHLTQQQMLTLQTDVYSELDQEIAQRLAYGIDHSSSVDARLRQAADLMRSWDGAVTIDSAPAAIVEAARSQLFRMLLEPKVGDDWRYYHWAESDFASEQILTNQPAAWLPAEYKTWDDFLTDLVRRGLAAQHAPSDLRTWRYGYAYPVVVEHPLYRLLPWFQRWTGTGVLPQSGDGTTVKQVHRTFGPSQRFTIDWSNIDGATENITMGESGDPLSPYYRDQWPYWYNGKTFAMPFSDAAVAAATAHTLRLQP
ncbi:MAG TPA: penicillin acylase family protein [Acidobacteriaceae bacterium]|nr:penicillin acylase family protein [Acidobacteriaceae bacterium]